MHSNRLPRSKADKAKKKGDLMAALKIYKCDSPCNISFSRKDHLNDHKKSKNCKFNHKFFCHFCGKPFVEESSYVNHIVYCRCPKQFNCNMCKTYFSKQKELIIHTCLMEIE